MYKNSLSFFIIQKLGVAFILPGDPTSNYLQNKTRWVKVCEKLVQIGLLASDWLEYFLKKYIFSAEQ